MVIVPERSVSKCRHAAAALPSNLRRLHASRNSIHESAFESSRSKTSRHARNKCPKDLSNRSRNFTHSASSGSAITHSIGFQESSHTKSLRSNIPNPFRSRQLKTHFRTLLSPMPGHPNDLRASLRTDAFMLFSRNHVPSMFLDAVAACGVSQIAAQLPKRSFAHFWNLASINASLTANSSKRTMPSLSPSQSLNKSWTWMFRLCIAQ
mmetsp:Transcript_97895/g.274075  ORF Transcript_97895/g.274075 Transcript_97895/m.274075 type:complete len:208 (+) Transcript_97895:1031-1654(+)